MSVNSSVTPLSGKAGLLIFFAFRRLFFCPSPNDTYASAFFPPHNWIQFRYTYSLANGKDINLLHPSPSRPALYGRRAFPYRSPKCQMDKSVFAEESLSLKFRFFLIDQSDILKY